MRKWLIAGLVLVILSGLVAFALLNLNTLLNQRKDALLAEVEERLGRPVTVEEIGVTLWGGIGIRLEGVAVADDPAFSRGEFLRVPELRVNVEFLPLLWKELRVSRLVLREPVVVVIREKNGAFNFVSLGPAETEQAPPPGAAAETVPPPPAAALPWLVSRVVITGGEVHYVDRGRGADVRVTQLDLRAEQVGTEQPVSLRLAAAALGAERQNVTVQGQIGPLGPAISQTPIAGDIQVDPLNLEVAQRALALQHVLPANVRVTGPVAVTARVEGVRENFSVAGTVDATASTLRVGEQFHKPPRVRTVFSTDARVTDTLIALQNARLALHTLELTGTGEIGRGEVLTLRLSLDSNRTELSDWQRVVLPLRGQDIAGNVEVHARVQGTVQEGQLPNIHGSLVLTDGRAVLPALPAPLSDLDAQLTFTEDRAELTEATARLGRSPVRVLSAQVQQWSPLRLTYRLTSPELWLADVGVDGANGERRDVLRAVESRGQIQATDGGWAYQGQASSAQGVLAGAGYTDLRTAASLAGQALTIESLTVHMFDGSLQGNWRYDFRPESPQFTLTSHVRGVDLRPLFHAVLASAPRLIEGDVNGTLRVTGAGSSWEEMRPTLHGQGQIEVIEGVLRDLNIAEQVLSAVTGVPGLSLLISPRVREKYPEIFATNDTQFTQLGSSLAIDGGRAHVEDLIMEAADWAVRGEGWIAFDGALDLRALLILSRRLSADIVESVKEARYILNEQERLEIPFALDGVLPQVRPKPDLAYVGRLLQRGLIRRGGEELRERLLEKIVPEGEQPEGWEDEPAGPERRKKNLPEELLRKGLEELLGR